MITTSTLLVFLAVISILTMVDNTLLDDWISDNCKG